MEMCGWIGGVGREREPERKENKAKRKREKRKQKSKRNCLVLVLVEESSFLLWVYPCLLGCASTPTSKQHKSGKDSPTPGGRAHTHKTPPPAPTKPLSFVFLHSMHTFPVEAGEGRGRRPARQHKKAGQGGGREPKGGVNPPCPSLFPPPSSHPVPSASRFPSHTHNPPDHHPELPSSQPTKVPTHRREEGGEQRDNRQRHNRSQGEGRAEAHPPPPKPIISRQCPPDPPLFPPANDEPMRLEMERRGDLHAVLVRLLRVLVHLGPLAGGEL